MTNKLFLASAIAGALALSAPAFADTILMDPDGNFNDAGLGVVEVDAMDLAPGNGLAVSSVPLSEGLQFEFYYQAEVTNLNSQSGTNITVPTGADGPYELTANLAFTEEVFIANDLNGDGLPDQITFNTLAGGSYELYYDSNTAGGINADDFTGNSGTGYDDGVLILSGVVQARLASSTFTLAFDSNGDIVIVPLDGFGTDDLNPVETVAGNGNAVVDVAIDFQDFDFFPEIVDILTLTLDGTLADPFDSVNPSLLVAGLTPNYGADLINGILGAGETGPEDYHFEVDANSSFTAVRVPEPGMLSLLGLAFAGLSLSRRRSRKA